MNEMSKRKADDWPCVFLRWKRTACYAPRLIAIRADSLKAHLLAQDLESPMGALGQRDPKV